MPYDQKGVRLARMNGEPRTLIVSGEGAAHGVPDQCVLHLALKVIADTAPQALDGVAEVATRTVQRLRELGIEGRDVQTTNLSLDDFYDRESQRVTARVASYSMTVKTGSIEEAGPVLAALSEVAGDSLQVGNLQLAVSDSRALQTTARRNAVEDAATRAGQLAEAAGVSLGPILQISEGQVASGRIRHTAMALSASAALPVEAGVVTSTASVTVTYAIEDSL